MYVDIKDFTDRQKVLFLNISIRSLIVSIRGKNRQILEMQKEKELMSAQLKELEQALTRKNIKIKNQKNRIKVLERY